MGLLTVPRRTPLKTGPAWPSCGTAGRVAPTDMPTAPRPGCRSQRRRSQPRRPVHVRRLWPRTDLARGWLLYGPGALHAMVPRPRPRRGQNRRGRSSPHSRRRSAAGVCAARAAPAVRPVIACRPKRPGGALPPDNHPAARKRCRARSGFAHRRSGRLHGKNAARGGRRCQPSKRGSVTAGPSQAGKCAAIARLQVESPPRRPWPVRGGGPCAPGGRVFDPLSCLSGRIIAICRETSR